MAVFKMWKQSGAKTIGARLSILIKYFARMCQMCYDRERLIWKAGFSNAVLFTDENLYRDGMCEKSQ